jgi:bifunctional non-homologous end joining protein LigD
LVEIGVVEVHPWAAIVDDYEDADQLVFHLDAGPGNDRGGARVCASCRNRRLECRPKMTGGKGLHVVAPSHP